MDYVSLDVFLCSLDQRQKKTLSSHIHSNTFSARDDEMLGINRREHLGATEAQDGAFRDDVCREAVETGGFETSSRRSEVSVSGFIGCDEEEEWRLCIGYHQQQQQQQCSIVPCTPLIDRALCSSSFVSLSCYGCSFVFFLFYLSFSLSLLRLHSYTHILVRYSSRTFMTITPAFSVKTFLLS